ERGGALRQTWDAVPGHVTLLSGGRSRTTVVDHGAVLLHTESKGGAHGVAARLPFAPHLHDRQALRKCEAVLVRRIDRALRQRRTGRRYDRPVHEVELP